MKRKEFVGHLSDYLEISNFSDYCPNGLQVEGKEEIKRVATAVSANLLTIEKAVAEGVDALIVHHGLFWTKDAYPIVGPKKRKLELLLNAGINLLAYHLPLDAHKQVGNNWRAAEALGWQELESFGEVGVKGNFKEVEIEEFIMQLERYYDHQAHTAAFGPKKVSSATLISGGAWRDLENIDTDCFITGNFDEPAFGWAQELGKHFLALGHSATEEVGPKALADYIEKQLKLQARFIEVKNPF